MITVEELLERARKRVDAAIRELAERAVEQAEAQFEHDLEALLADRIPSAELLADAPDPAPAKRTRRSSTRVEPQHPRSDHDGDGACAACEPEPEPTTRAPRPCGCAATGRHRATCALAGKQRTRPSALTRYIDNASRAAASDASEGAPDSKDDDEEVAPEPARTGKHDRFAAIEARAAARRQAVSP